MRMVSAEYHPRTGWKIHYYQLSNGRWVEVKPR